MLGSTLQSSCQRPLASLTATATDSIMENQAEVAQVVEHGTENAGVDSSSLSLGTFLCLRIREGVERAVLTTLRPELLGKSTLNGPAKGRQEPHLPGNPPVVTMICARYLTIKPGASPGYSVSWPGDHKYAVAATEYLSSRNLYGRKRLGCIPLPNWKLDIA